MLFMIRFQFLRRNKLKVSIDILNQYQVRTVDEVVAIEALLLREALQMTK